MVTSTNARRKFPSEKVEVDHGYQENVAEDTHGRNGLNCRETVPKNLPRGNGNVHKELEKCDFGKDEHVKTRGHRTSSMSDMDSRNNLILPLSNNRHPAVGQYFKHEQHVMFNKLSILRQISETHPKNVESGDIRTVDYDQSEKRDYGKEDDIPHLSGPEYLCSVVTSYPYEKQKGKNPDVADTRYRVDGVKQNKLLGKEAFSVDNRYRDDYSKKCEENDLKGMRFNSGMDKMENIKEFFEEELPDCNQCTEKSLETLGIAFIKDRIKVDKNGCEVMNSMILQKTNFVGKNKNAEKENIANNDCVLKNNVKNVLAKAFKEENNAKLSKQVIEMPTVDKIVPEKEDSLLNLGQLSEVIITDGMASDGQAKLFGQNNTNTFQKFSNPEEKACVFEHINLESLVKISIFGPYLSNISNGMKKKRGKKGNKIRIKRKNHNVKPTYCKRCRNYFLQKRVCNRNWEYMEFKSWGSERVEAWTSPFQDGIEQIMKRITIRKSKFSRPKPCWRKSGKKKNAKSQHYKGSGTKKENPHRIPAKHGNKRCGDYGNPSDSAGGQGGSSHGGARPKEKSNQPGQRGRGNGLRPNRHGRQGNQGDDDGEDDDERKRWRGVGAFDGNYCHAEQREEEEMEIGEDHGSDILPHGSLDFDVVDALGILGDTEPGGGCGALALEIMNKRKLVSQEFAKCLIHQLGQRERRASVDCHLCLHLVLLLKHAAKMECEEHCQLCCRLLRVIKSHLQSCIIALARQRSVSSNLDVPFVEETACQIKLCVAVQKRIVESGKELNVASLEDLLRKKKLWLRIREHLRAIFHEGTEKPPEDLPNFSSISLQSGMSGLMGFGSGISGNDSVFFSSRLASRAPAQPTIPEEPMGSTSGMSSGLAMGISAGENISLQSQIEPEVVSVAQALPKTPSATQQRGQIVYNRISQVEHAEGPATMGHFSRAPLRPGTGLHSLPALGHLQEEQRGRLVSEQHDTSLQHTDVVKYGPRNHLVDFAQRWEEMKRRIIQGNIDFPPGPEEGIILSRFRSMLRLQRGRYRKHHEWQRVTHLGNGVFGKCHLAVDLSNNFQFCVKRIPLVKFEPCELEIWSSLHHPCIVQIYGAIRRQDKIYIFAEFIDGGSLAELIEEQKQLNSWMALFYFNQLLNILHYLQNAGVLHDDLKADNILLRANTLQIVLTDFGLCQQVASSRNPRVAPNVSPVGAQTQWSPEKAASEGYDVKAMVWAAGCILVHMLSGHYTWTRGYGHLKMLHFVIVSKSPPLWDIPDGLPPEVVELIHCCWNVEPDQRPPPSALLNHGAFDLLNRNFTSGTFVHHIVESLSDENVPSVVGDVSRMESLPANRALTQSITSEMDLYGAELLSGPVLMSGGAAKGQVTNLGDRFSSGPKMSGSLIPPIGPARALPLTCTTANSGNIPNLSIFQDATSESSSMPSIDLEYIERSQGQGNGDQRTASIPIPPFRRESKKMSRTSMDLAGGDHGDLDIQFNYTSQIVEPPKLNYDIEFAASSQATLVGPQSLLPTRTPGSGNIPTPNLGSLPNLEALNLRASTSNPKSPDFMFIGRNKLEAATQATFSEVGRSSENQHVEGVANFASGSPSARRKVELFINITTEDDGRPKYSGLPDSHSAPALQSTGQEGRPIHRSTTFPDGRQSTPKTSFRREISRQTSGFGDMTPSPSHTTPSPQKSNKSSGFGDLEGAYNSRDLPDFNETHRWLQEQISRENDPEKQEQYIKAVSDLSDPEEVEEKHESEGQEKAVPLKGQDRLNMSTWTSVEFTTGNGNMLTQLKLYKRNHDMWHSVITAMAERIHKADTSLQKFTVRHEDGVEIDLTDSVLSSQQHSTVKAIVIPAPDGSTSWTWRMVAGSVQYASNFAGQFSMFS